MHNADASKHGMHVMVVTSCWEQDRGAAHLSVFLCTILQWCNSLCVRHALRPHQAICCFFRTLALFSLLIAVPTKTAVCTCPLCPPHATGCIRRVAHWAVHGKAALASADRNSTEVHAEASLNWHNRALQLEETDTCARPTTRSVSAAGATAFPAAGLPHAVTRAWGQLRPFTSSQSGKSNSSAGGRPPMIFHAHAAAITPPVPLHANHAQVSLSHALPPVSPFGRAPTQPSMLPTVTADSCQAREPGTVPDLTGSHDRSLKRDAGRVSDPGGAGPLMHAGSGKQHVSCSHSLAPCDGPDPKRARHQMERGSDALLGRASSPVPNEGGGQQEPGGAGTKLVALRTKTALLKSILHLMTTRGISHKEALRQLHQESLMRKASNSGSGTSSGGSVRGTAAAPAAAARPAASRGVGAELGLSATASGDVSCQPCRSSGDGGMDDSDTTLLAELLSTQQAQGWSMQRPSSSFQIGLQGQQQQLQQQQSVLPRPGGGLVARDSLHSSGAKPQSSMHPGASALHPSGQRSCSSGQVMPGTWSAGAATSGLGTDLHWRNDAALFSESSLQDRGLAIPLALQAAAQPPWLGLPPSSAAGGAAMADAVAGSAPRTRVNSRGGPLIANLVRQCSGAAPSTDPSQNPTAPGLNPDGQTHVWPATGAQQRSAGPVMTMDDVGGDAGLAGLAPVAQSLRQGQQALAARSMAASGFEGMGSARMMQHQQQQGSIAHGAIQLPLQQHHHRHRHQMAWLDQSPLPVPADSEVTLNQLLGQPFGPGGPYHSSTMSTGSAGLQEMELRLQAAATRQLP